MKAIFSTLSIAALCALVTSIPASYYHVIDENKPNTDVSATYGSQTAVISRSDTTLDIDTLVNFEIPDLSSIPGASASSTCDFVVFNAASVSGSQTLQLFTLVSEVDLTGPVTFNSAPSSDQYKGMYFIQEGATTTSLAIDVTSFPCQFGTTMQFIMRPQNDNDFITWTQGGAGAVPVGAFIEIRN